MREKGARVKGLIVAAGLGSRLRSIAPLKPLAKVNGVPLIESIILAARQAGLSEIVVVTGYLGDQLEAFLKHRAAGFGVPIRTVRAADWTLANGHSVAAAEAELGDSFVLMMADHLFDPTLLRDLLAAGPITDGVVLAIDRRLDNPLVDLDDVTRVATDAAGRITRIGKMIEPYDAFDTGVFLASRALIVAIRADIAAGGQGSISAGMTRLAQDGRAGTFDIGERFWLDVDDATAWQHAERLMA